MIETKNLTPENAKAALRAAKDLYCGAVAVKERVAARVGVESLEGQIRDLEERHKATIADLKAQLKTASTDPDYEAACGARNSADWEVKLREKDLRTSEAVAEIRGHGFEHGERVALYEEYDARDRFSRQPAMMRYRLVGEAIIEAYRHGDDYPENLRWSAPAPGDVILRLCNKDGSVGKKIRRHDFGYYNDSKEAGWIKDRVFKLGADPMKARPLKAAD